MNQYSPLDPKGYFGKFGGCFVPEILTPALESLDRAFRRAEKDHEFQTELGALLKNFAGRPTPLSELRHLGREYGVRIFLKREDLLHGGAHKTNQVLGQALLAISMGKSRIIAETGAGQHGVATAMVCAALGLKATIYMGSKDCARQQQNLFRMELLGAEVIPVDSGPGTLKDAINEALRDWSASYEDTHYLLGTAAGPHPYPTMVRQFQRVIGDEARAQILERCGRLPDAAIACVGGGSNAIGLFTAFLGDHGVDLIGVEPAGKGLNTDQHGATLLKGKPGVLHGTNSFILQDDDGQICQSHSISAGLDYPAVGPEHAHLMTSGRALYDSVDDLEALSAFRLLSQKEGIIPALESAHAVAYALKMATSMKPGSILLVNLSGRGDKDLDLVRQRTSGGESAAKGTSASGRTEK